MSPVMRIIAVALCLALQSCALLEVAEYRDIERVPLEPPVAATAKPEKPEAWYRPIVEGVGGLIKLEPVIAIVENVRLAVTDLAETIANSVRDVKTQTQYTEHRVKYFRLFGTGETKIELDKNGVKKK